MDATTLIIYIFFGFVFVLIILIGIAFLRALFGVHPAAGAQADSKMAETKASKEDQNETATKEDSEGDGLMLFDDPMFPPEFDDNDDM